MRVRHRSSNVREKVRSTTIIEDNEPNGRILLWMGEDGLSCSFLSQQLSAFLG
jgi:hypothetical protein